MARVSVFAPSPKLTVTIESTVAGAAELHLHGGGQGVWIARLIVALGCEVSLCGPFGGEVGAVAREILNRGGVTVHAVDAVASNGAYVHDRRGGDRVVVADIDAGGLDRHETDRLYNVALVDALDADVCVLGGSDESASVAPDMYRRLARDLGGRVIVIADLAGEEMREALGGGLSVLKTSHDDLRNTGVVTSGDRTEIADAARRLHEDGAQTVLITRAEQPAIAYVGGRLLQVVSPVFEAVDHHGAGDSTTAAIAVGLARGCDIEQALRLGAAAGALNVTRRGLGSGEAGLVESLAGRIRLESVGGG